ncbi:MAG: glycosyltransferase family 39 protein [Candidatus Acidiferrales bacterium]
MSRRNLFVMLMAVILLASFLRLLHFASIPPGLYPDEAMDGNSALEAAHTSPFLRGLKVFYPENNGREGLYVNAVAVLFKISGAAPEPWVVRLPAAISGILTVAGLYFLAAELFSVEVGLLAAFLLATSFWHIDFSRIGFRAIMAPLFLTWTLYFLLKAFRKLRNGASSLRVVPFFLISGVLWALGFYTYIAYRVTPALILLVFAFYWLERRKGITRSQVIRAAAVFCSFSAIVSVPLAYYFRTNPGTFFERASQISVFGSATPLRDLARNTWKTLAMFNIRGDANWRHNISARPELFWPVGILFLLGIVIGLSSLFSKAAKSTHEDAAKDASAGIPHSRFPFALLFAWFLLAMLPVVISDDIAPHALRALLMIPCAFLFAAVGGHSLYQWLRKFVEPRWLKLATIGFLGLLTFHAYHAYFVVWAGNPNVPDAFNSNYVIIGRELNSLPASTPKYLVVEARGVLVRGIPMPAQTIMFITDTFGAEEQAAKNIHYVLPDEESSIPGDAKVFYLRDRGIGK